MKVDKNLLIKAQYTLYTVGADGKEEMVEQTSPEMPLTYIQGMGLMLADFENNLLGLDEGEKFDFVLTPEQAYGHVSEDYITTLPKEVFLVEGEFDEEVVFVGGQVPMLDSEGNQLLGKVLEISEEGVKMDFNPLLAGETLHFVGEIQEVTEPTPDEVQAILNPHTGGGCCGCGHEEQG
ncbi:MAG: FKBP-type peptidyl-prolyl cis-trans isomerase, partial [Porphyromonas sp.]|nr:FKBP-type peptidyl-prolyl cis-trans isomerase [Porphyromonas sp.]